MGKGLVAEDIGEEHIENIVLFPLDDLSHFVGVCPT